MGPLSRKPATLTTPLLTPPLITTPTAETTPSQILPNLPARTRRRAATRTSVPRTSTPKSVRRLVESVRKCAPVVQSDVLMECADTSICVKHHEHMCSTPSLDD